MVTVSQCGWLVAVVRLCLSVCLSVTNRSSTETDKHRNLRIDRITRTTPHVAYGEFPDVACFLIKLERTITIRYDTIRDAILVRALESRHKSA